MTTLGFLKKIYFTTISVADLKEPASYFTVAGNGEGRLTEKMSRFLSFAFHISSAEEAKEIIKDFSNRYHDARHVCWAYMLGPLRETYLSSDNGEPSGTAGKPILGQINSACLTDVLVVVVRYFGGIKLGTPGLIAAYREAARLALADAGKKEITRTTTFVVRCDYPELHKVMKIIKDYDLTIVSQNIENICNLVVEVPVTLTNTIGNYHYFTHK